MSLDAKVAAETAVLASLHSDVSRSELLWLSVALTANFKGVRKADRARSLALANHSSQVFRLVSRIVYFDADVALWGFVIDYTRHHRSQFRSFTLDVPNVFHWSLEALIALAIFVVQCNRAMF